MENKERLMWLFIGWISGVAWGMFILNMLWNFGIAFPMRCSIAAPC